GVLVLLAAFAVFAYLFEPARPSQGVAVVAPPQVSGVPATPKPAAAPTAAATQAAPAQAQPTSHPTSPPASQPTVPATQPASVRSTSVTAAQAKPTAGSPVDTIRQHYGFIDAKRYADGYALMDAHL